jgi:hypothetical protein
MYVAIKGMCVGWFSVFYFASEGKKTEPAFVVVGEDVLARPVLLSLTCSEGLGFGFFIVCF